MTEPDELDRSITERLRGLAPDGDDTDAALAGFRPRARRARQRRRAALAGGAAVVVIAVVGAGALVAGGRGNGRVTTPPGDEPHVTTVAPTTTPSTTADTTPDTAPTSTPVSAPPVTTGAPPSPTPTTAGAPAPAEPQVVVFDLPEGGSITVRLQDGELSIDEVNPPSGYTVEEARVEADRVRVHFRNADGDEHRLEVRAEGGQLVLERNE